jgi:predicted DNA-binding transcriptional regulator YafY
LRSHPAVYRDAEALSSAGVPIDAERGRAGGIRLLPGYRTDVTGLTHDEARALFVLTTGGAHEDLGLGTAARSAILKVMRAADSDGEPRLFRVSRQICAAHLDGPLGSAADAAADGGEWVEVRLRFAAVPAARTLLSFGGNVGVTSPPEVRADLAAIAAEVVAQYSNTRLGTG